jgi:Zn-dependent alcohol dehydrogenase
MYIAGTSDLAVDEIEIADPAPGQVRVEVHHCGICHSDWTVLEGDYGQAPMVLGHEAAGIVDAVGDGVTSLRPGDKVVLTPIASCGRCYWCSRGEPGGCVTNSNVFGATFADGSTGLSRGDELVYRGMGVGGFAEYALVTEAGAVKVPDDTPLDIACVIGCAVQTGAGAVVNTAKVEPGSTVLVLGLGGIGLSVVQGARIAGAARIIVSDPVADRRALAETFGATDLVDPTTEDLQAAVLAATDGIGVDYAFEAAGVGALQLVGIEACRSGGTTVLVGAPAVDHDLTIPNALFFGMTEKKIAGCFMGSANSARDIPRYLALWRTGQLDLEGLITARVPLAEINDGFADLRAGKGVRTIVDVRR